ncbi:MAG: hypothetical protein HOP10_15855 [Chitinophagaceae bacterium]|nr:hypothetical protein [Chitinophagaceae bacterium]
MAIKLLLHYKPLSLKRFKKILLWFFLSLLFLIVAAYILIQTPLGQNWIAKQVTKRLSRDLQTKVSIKHVDFSLFNRMHLEGVLIEDQQGDTLMYADDVKVRITDWFFFKKNIDLKYIGLENAIIKFQRTDSVWRQQFFFDYFASSPGKSSKKKAGIRFNLKQVEMKNVTFLKKDTWLGQDMTAHVGGMIMSADKLSLSGNAYEINSMILTDPVVALRHYSKLKPTDSLKKTDPAEEIIKTLSWNNKMTVKVANLKIINGTFKDDKQTDRPAFAHFDGKHILFTEINGELNNSIFIGDTIFSKLKLTAKERSGVELKSLTADAKMTPQQMAFSNMELVTNRSTIRNYFSMSYNNIGEMGDFIHKVKMAAVLDDSYVDSDDIAFFAPKLETWKKKISIKGKVRGTVDDMAGSEMLVQAGNSTLLNGDISLTGLPDINRTFIDFKANDFRTTYGDAVTIVPAMRGVTSPDLKTIQYVNFRGNFTGFIRDFVTFGTIQTNLGTVTTDINMKLPAGQQPIYSGNIATDNFRLGEFLGDENIGSVSLTAKVQGTGFNSTNRNTLIDGTIRFVDYQDYRYQNIGIKGRLDKNLFEGIASIRDDNADIDLNGKIDFNNKPPVFKLTADVARSNLQNLKLIKDNIVFRGKLDLDFSSNSIDNFSGTARITEAEISKDGNILPFDSLIIASSYVNNEKILKVTSNEFEGTVSGDFSIKDLPGAFELILNKYYPAYVKMPKRFPGNQNIKFDIRTYYVDQYISLIDSSISGFNNSHFAGNLDLTKNEINFMADVPQFKFKQYNFDDVKLTANGDIDKLVLSGQAKNIFINDSLSVPQAIFKVTARNDSSIVSILSGATQTLDKADMNALVRTFSDGVEIEFDPSSITINGKIWTIDANGVLRFRKNSPASGDLVLSEGEQRIRLRTQPSAKGNKSDVVVELTKVNLGDISPYLLPKNRLEGLISGNIFVEDPTGDIKITSNDLYTQYLRMDNDSLGEVKATIDYNKITKELTFKGNTLNQVNYLGFDGHIFIGDPDKAKTNNIITLKAKDFEIKYIERFLRTLFSDMRGYLTGDIILQGENISSITGKGRLRDAGLKVNFTQCFYWIKDTDIELTPQEINLNGLVLTDSITKNPIYITGGIEHQSFRNMFYDLYISTRKPGTRGDDNNRPVQLINTGYKHNKQFYGSVKGTGSLSLAGPQSDMYMTIDAFASARDSSYVTIPASGSRESGIADFLVERKFGREMEESGASQNLTNIIYDVDVTANPMVNVKVILDELTGDIIKGRGRGTLKIRSGSSEPLSIRGRYDIEEGDYLFTFQSFFKKPFVLKKEASNYIEWSGDPNDAKINLTAIYNATNVSFAPLAKSWTNLDQGLSRARGEVSVIANLTERLFQPKIDFSLEFPQSSVVNSDPGLAFSLQQLQKNTNEMNKQATYLVVFGIFAPVESGFITKDNFGEIATNSLSGVFFNVINDKVKNFLSSLGFLNKYDINFSSSVYNRNVIDPDSKLSLGGNVNLSVGRSFFDGKLIISVAGTAEGVTLGSTVRQDVQILPNLNIEVLLNPSGTFRANLFYRENIDYLTTSSGVGRSNRKGAGLSYRKEAERFWDLFFKRKNKKTVQPEAKKEEVLSQE